MENNKKRIGIDARFYGPVGKGLGRYTKEVVDRILNIDKENNYVIFLCQENFNEFKCSNPKVKKVLINARWYSFMEQIEFPYRLWREKIDLMHFPHFNVPYFCPVKFLVTIHDLILTKFPTQRASTLSPFFYKIKNLGYKIVIKNAIKNSEKIIAVSNFTKNDIINHFQAEDSKIIVTYEGLTKDIKNNDDIDDKQVILRYNIKKPYILYVGNAYPHKNLEFLIKILPDIREKFNNLNLVLVGKNDYFYSRLIEIAKNSGGKVIFPGFVPDSDLKSLYKEAAAYVFPSLYEGFGLPPLEAMAYGCPVISSSEACMPEILDKAAYFFNPRNKKETIEKITDVLENEDLKNSLTIKGYELIKKYSWDKCASETLNIYFKIIS